MAKKRKRSKRNSILAATVVTVGVVGAVYTAYRIGKREYSEKSSLFSFQDIKAKPINKMSIVKKRIL